MVWLRALYDWTLRLAGHRHAIWLLAFVSFIESSVFPIPPDVMLIPMILAAREKTWRIALVCTLASVAGGLFGYAIGFYFYDLIGREVVALYGYAHRFDELRALYDEWGAVIVFTAGFSPVPYKLFTITSGVFAQDLLTFTLASVVSRGARFFLVAALLWKFGRPIKAFIERYLGPLTLAFVVLLIGGFALLRFAA